MSFYDVNPSEYSHRVTQNSRIYLTFSEPVILKTEREVKDTQEKLNEIINDSVCWDYHPGHEIKLGKNFFECESYAFVENEPIELTDFDVTFRYYVTVDYDSFDFSGLDIDTEHAIGKCKESGDLVLKRIQKIHVENHDPDNELDDIYY